MNARTVFSFSLVLALAACGDPAAENTTSATPTKDSAAPKTSGATSAAKAQPSAPTSAAPPPTVAASAPSASASVATTASAPKVVSSAPARLTTKEQDDLMAQMMGSGPIKPAASAGPAASSAAPAGDKVADAFTGAPDAAVKLGKTLKVAGYSIDLPDGWEGSDADNVIKANSKGKGAWIFATGGAANDEGVTAFLKKNATADGVKWSAANPLKIGKAAVDGKLSKGTGKVGADDADVSYFAAGDGAVYLATVVTKKSTDAERNELIAAVRSFRK
ncbi:MAG: hypothetical protein U0414_09960 [Polyangiaceae bacterium]